MSDRRERVEACPFCGAIVEWDDDDLHVIHSKDCYLAFIDTDPDWIVGRQVEAWNRRALLAPREEVGWQPNGTPSEEICFERLSMTLTKGAAKTWDELFHAAETREEEPGLREACEQLKKRARPYEDESGIIEIPLHDWGAFLSVLAARPVDK